MFSNPDIEYENNYGRKLHMNDAKTPIKMEQKDLVLNFY